MVLPMSADVNVIGSANAGEPTMVAAKAAANKNASLPLIAVRLDYLAAVQHRSNLEVS